MAYINAQQVKEIREQIKKAFPTSKGWKFSVTNDNHSSVCIAIMQAPLNFMQPFDNAHGDNYQQLNRFHFKSQFSGEMLTTLEKLNTIAEGQGWYDRSDAMTDYFDTAYYINIHIGKWNKPFVYKEHAKQESAPAQMVEGETKVNDSLSFLLYSERCYVLTGDTKPLKNKLGREGLKLKFNSRLTHPQTGENLSGWLVPVSRFNEVKTAISA